MNKLIKWHVVKVDTPDGKRIGIIEEQQAEGLEIMSDNPLDQTDALKLSSRMSYELNLPLFDNRIDEACI